MKDTKYKTQTEKLNDSNIHDYTTKTNGGYRRQLDKDITFDRIENTNWNHESNYHNSYRVNGKYVKGRAIILSKKK